MKLKELKEYIKDIPDDVDVYTERVHDIYFDKHWWKTTKVIDRNTEEVSTELIEPFCVWRWNDSVVIYNHW